MKKCMYVGCLTALVVGAAWLGISNVPQIAFAQPASGQQYYDYHSLNTADATTQGVVWTTQTEERFAIHTVMINGPTAMQVRLLDGSTEITTYYYAANGGACPIYDLQSKTKGNDLTIQSNVAGRICITVVGNSLWY